MLRDEIAKSEISHKTTVSIEENIGRFRKVGTALSSLFGYET